MKRVLYYEEKLTFQIPLLCHCPLFPPLTLFFSFQIPPLSSFSNSKTNKTLKYSLTLC
ncbi:transmembrane protein, putative [Medicago truncatula]|uniref:Transmembrane protein, putative n=1 Tax=Medicago truncatula TaxID=3880 RepID=G7I8H1_MEDTR|nr:transmembrane protein, putative [Medicago truncatula]